MADLILRFELFTNSNVNISDISKRLPQNSIEEIYALGDEFGKHIRKESSIDYAYKYKNISAVDSICKEFVTEWKEYESIISQLRIDFAFKSFILFEFDLDGGGHPELVFDKEFILFLSNIKTELQLYFYI